MKPITSWENFDIKSFDEMCCAGGTCGISDFAPENVLTVTSAKEEKDELKESNTDYGVEPKDSPLTDFISKLDLDHLEKDEFPEIYMGESTTWEKFSLKEGDQVAQPAQPQVQAAQAAQTAQPTQPAQQAASIPAQQPVNTTPAQVAPQSQIANPDAAAQPAQPAVNNAQPQAAAQPAAQAQQPVAQPQVQAAQPVQQAAQLPESITSWADYEKMKESIALPGGMLNAEPTEYEKELEKHNQARKNTKSPEVNIGDKDAGEIGIHDFDENGMPTGVKEKVTTDIKATELKPNEKATIVDQKKKFKHWDD